MFGTVIGDSQSSCLVCEMSSKAFEAFLQLVDHVLVTELGNEPARIYCHIPFEVHCLPPAPFHFRWLRFALNEQFGSVQYIYQSKAEEGWKDVWCRKPKLP
jgi:hypothetical protein